MAFEELIKELRVEFHLIIYDEVGFEVIVGLKEVILAVHESIDIVHHGFNGLNELIDVENKNGVKNIHD